MKDRQPPLHFLAAWRRKKGYTQTQLAERAGVDHSTISRAETGAADLSRENTAKVLGVLRISAWELYCDPADPHGVWALAGKIAALPETERATVRTMVDALVEQSEGGTIGKTEVIPIPNKKKSSPKRRA